ncbi:MAG TPA: TA system VapC family ribonuclease toxin [Bryobacteraceae bacterium]|nr:TA system VapC family ribonuclease toxin [Bryobacteraceae bacterium]
MKPYLLDVNVLIALVWPSHVHHRLAQTWFAERRSVGFCTCPLTEIGFLRIFSNPKFTRKAVLPAEALALLQRIKAMAEHEFWTDDLPVTVALGGGESIVGHRQITDAYLLALARSRGGLLATFDRGALSLVRRDEGLVELVGLL